MATNKELTKLFSYLLSASKNAYRGHAKWADIGYNDDDGKTVTREEVELAQTMFNNIVKVM